MSSSWRLMFGSFSEVLQMFFNNKSIDEIHNEKLMSDPEVRKAYDAAILRLRKGESEKEDVNVGGKKIFEIHTTSV